MPHVRDSTKGKINNQDLSLQSCVMNAFLRILPPHAVSSYISDNDVHMKMPISYIGVLYLNHNYSVFLISVCT